MTAALEGLIISSQVYTFAKQSYIDTEKLHTDAYTDIYIYTYIT